MIKTIMFEEVLRPDEGDKYIFERSFIAEMNTEDVENNINNIQNNINAFEKDLNEIGDIDTSVKNKLIELDNDFKIRTEAYNNYDKYFSDNIIEMKKNKDKDKLQLKKYLDNFEEIKRNIIEKHKEQTLNMIKSKKTKLQKEYDMLKIYEGYNKHE